MAVKPTPQLSVYETVIENAELEALLEQRETKKACAREASKAYRDVHEAVKVQLDDCDIADAPVRIGRFVVSQKEHPGRSVSFETNQSTRLSIRLLVEEE